jgi:ankyrin repeat protein
LNKIEFPISQIPTNINVRDFKDSNSKPHPPKKFKNFRQLMDKEKFTSRTNEIKEQKLSCMTNTFEILKFYIQDKCEQKFRECFIKHFKYPEECDSSGNTLLNLAVQADLTNTTTFLLDFNCDVNTQNQALNTPLHYALSKNNFEIANILIKRKADEKLENAQGFTPWQCLNRNLD